MDLDKRLKELGLNPEDYADDDAKKAAIKEAEDDAGEDNDKGGNKAKTVALEQYNRVKERLTGELADTKEQLTKLQGELDGLKEAAGDKDKLETELERIKGESEAAAKDAEAKLAASDKGHAIESALLQAGCKDVKAMRAHIAEDDIVHKDGKLAGLDTAELKKQFPYLYGEVQKGSTGATPAATTEKDDDDQELNEFLSMVKR